MACYDAVRPVDKWAERADATADGAPWDATASKDQMTDLLQRAIAAIEKLPEDVQDAIATRLLAEATDEQAWQERFQATTDAQWEGLAEEARRSIAARSTPLEEAFPPLTPL